MHQSVQGYKNIRCMIQIRKSFLKASTKKIPANKIAKAAKAFADADNIMAELKEFDPELPAWKEYEEPGDR